MPTASAVLALEPLHPCPPDGNPSRVGMGTPEAGVGVPHTCHVFQVVRGWRTPAHVWRVRKASAAGLRAPRGSAASSGNLDGPGRGCVAASGTQCLQQRQPKRKTKEEKHSTQIYVSQVRRKELGSAARQADAPCADTHGRRCPGAALDSRGKGATRGPWSVWTVLGTSFIILCGHLTG